MGCRLLRPAMRQHDPPVSRPEISRPAESDVLLENFRAGATERPQIGISRYDNPIVLGKGRQPGRLPRNLSNSRRQFVVRHLRRRRIEPREFSELNDAAAHHETMLRKPLRLMRAALVARRRVAMMELQRRFVSESERVPLERKRP